MVDVKLQKFFDINRWEEILAKSYDKRIDMGLLRRLCDPAARLQLLTAIENDQYRIAPPHIAKIPKDNGDFREVYVNEPIDRIFLSLYNDVLFEMFGDRIHPACNLDKYDGWISFPTMDNDGDIEFCGNKFSQCRVQIGAME